MMVKGGLASDYPSGAAGRAGAAFDADDDNDADLGEEYEEGKRLKEVREGDRTLHRVESRQSFLVVLNPNMAWGFSLKR